MSAQSGATTTIARALLTGNHQIGVQVEDVGTSAMLRDVVIRDTQEQESDGRGGRALNVQRGARATVIRALISENTEIAVYAASRDTSLTLSDVIIRDTRGQRADRTGGRGLSVLSGATVELTRGLLAGNRELGVFATGDGTSLTLSDVVIHDTEEQESTGTGGRGLGVQEGATATITRAFVSRSREAGVFVDGPGTEVTLSDVVIQDALGQGSTGWWGRGLAVQSGATTEVDHAVILRNRDLGVYIRDEGTSVTLSDVVIRDTLGQVSDGTGGRGLSVELGATATVTRALLSQNREVGVIALGAGASARLADVIVAQTNEQACGRTTCTERPFGVGIAGAQDGSVVATRFAVRDAVLCGVMVASNGQVDLSEGEVTGSEIGVCLQVDGYSVPRLTDRVRYADNGTNLDTTSLPLPELASALDGAD